MLGTLLLLGILQTVMAVSAIALSLWFLPQGPAALQLPLSVTTVALAALGLFVLANIFEGAQPTILPHLAFALSPLLATLQCLIAPSQRAQGSTANEFSS